MSNHNRIVAHIRIRNRLAVPVKYTRKYNALNAKSQESIKGGDGMLLHAMAQKLSYVHNVGGSIVTFGPKATKRVVAKLDQMGLSAVVEFGRVKESAGGEVVVTDNVNQKRYAAIIAGA
ncbi:hypothetical protein [Limnoglobus roseus]|uniref:Uncharacterized protein n=1 Tax=Limnoglobus roseus TaxID=2598579 RepID=A0A5C1AWD6_9BACT|nr:hypothetical protein [Limnoglobus roseus]QEL21098.1 hypothetical protein PX52LOC_08227 [Limnoglobus roseus]